MRLSFAGVAKGVVHFGNGFGPKGIAFVGAVDGDFGNAISLVIKDVFVGFYDLPVNLHRGGESKNDDFDLKPLTPGAVSGTLRTFAPRFSIACPYITMGNGLNGLQHSAGTNPALIHRTLWLITGSKHFTSSAWWSGLPGCSILVRLFIYHVEAQAEPEPAQSILIKTPPPVRNYGETLYTIITTPGMVVTVAMAGALLWQMQGSNVPHGLDARRTGSELGLLLGVLERLLWSADGKKAGPTK